MIRVINWFEIPIKDMERAKKFYEKVFEVQLEATHTEELKMWTFPMPKKETSGASGALVMGKGYSPSAEGVTVYFSCKDLAIEAERVTQHGGKLLFPKKAIGEWGFIAHFLDTEGNRIGLHSMH